MSLVSLALLLYLVREALSSNPLVVSGGNSNLNSKSIVPVSRFQFSLPINTEGVKELTEFLVENFKKALPFKINSIEYMGYYFSLEIHLNPEAILDDTEISFITCSKDFLNSVDPRCKKFINLLILNIRNKSLDLEVMVTVYSDKEMKKVALSKTTIKKIIVIQKFLFQVGFNSYIKGFFPDINPVIENFAFRLENPVNSNCLMGIFKFCVKNTTNVILYFFENRLKDYLENRVFEKLMNIKNNYDALD